jgi:hypothetical protein
LYSVTTSIAMVQIADASVAALWPAGGPALRLLVLSSLGTYSGLETLLWGSLSAGLQNNPTERKRSHVTKRIMHIVGYV